MDTIDQTLTIKSFVGEYEVIGSGCAPSLSNMPLKLTVEDLSFTFDFVSDSEIKGKKVTKNNIDDKNGVFTLLNFDNSLGSGLLNPWYLGIISERKLYVTFWIWTPNIKEDKRLVNWTLMLGENI